MRSTPWRVLAAMALLAGCASKGPGTAVTSPALAPAPVPAPALAVPQAAPPALAAERYWLEQLFSGTPVTVASAPEAGVKVAVPLRFAFDGQAVVVKPPLAAVLDKLATSLQRQQRVQVRVAAPTPVQGEQLRTQLIRRGIAPWRIAQPAAHAGQVEFQLWVPPA